ncbi:unnamed protein product [Mesocestoides corti]|uniref:EF-hand domain-containing protein n=1 Tax=Mesocestoides corti TaxID=53468 RepID=A0A158QSQ6_MESCO|nr:unnamed protein product [Mesocestoides corti]
MKRVVSDTNVFEVVKSTLATSRDPDISLGSLKMRNCEFHLMKTQRERDRSLQLIAITLAESTNLGEDPRISNLTEVMAQEHPDRKEENVKGTQSRKADKRAMFDLIGMNFAKLSSHVPLFKTKDLQKSRQMSPETVSLTTLAKQQSLNLTDLEPIILRGQENAIDGITKIESSTPQVPANHRNPCEKSTELISGDATGEQPIDLTCQGTKDTTQTAGCTKTLPTDGDTSHGLHQKAPREPRHARKEHQMTRGVKQEANADLIRALRIQPLFTSIDFDGTGLILGQNVVQILQRYRVKRPERILENLGFRTESTVSRQILTDAILTAFRMEKSASTFAYLLATVCIDELKTLTKMEEAWVESPNGNKGPSNFLECHPQLQTNIEKREEKTVQDKQESDTAEIGQRRLMEEVAGFKALQAKVDELMEAKRTLEAEIEEMRLSRQLGSEFAVKVEQLSVTNNRLNFERFREAELRSATLETTSEIKLVNESRVAAEQEANLVLQETNERLREEIRQLTQTSADLRKRLDETGESVQGQAKTLSDAMDKNIELRVELERTHDALENEMRFSDVQKRENEYLNAMLERLTKELSEMRNLYRESEGTRCANRVEITALQEHKALQDARIQQQAGENKRLTTEIADLLSEMEDLRQRLYRREFELENVTEERDRLKETVKPF